MALGMPMQLALEMTEGELRDWMIDIGEAIMEIRGG
jgi:hypothetical protein